MMDPSLAGLRVWITRPGAVARRSARRFEELGARCLLEPTVRLEGVSMGVQDRHRLLRFLPEGRLVLTSANAARHLLESLVGDPHLQEAVRAVPASAVGEATARAAQELGYRVDHLASVALGVELAREIGREFGGGHVILPGSDLRREDTEARLREEGVEVLSLTVYQTLPVEELGEASAGALRDDALDAVALYSPSAVQGLLHGAHRAGLEIAALPALLALGPTTADACAAAGRPAAVVPAEPGEPALLDAVARWWTGRGGAS